MKTFLIIVILFVALKTSFSQIIPNCVDAASDISAIPSSSVPGRVSLNWTKSNKAFGVTGFSVTYTYEHSLDNVNYNFVAAGSTLNAQIDLAPGTNYFFAVRTDAFCSDLGNPLEDHIVSSAINVLTFPVVPTLNESATRASAQSNAINFSWNAVSGIVSGYDIEISNEGGVLSTQSVSAPTNSLLVNELSSGANYFYRVRAKNASGASAYTNSSAAIITRPAAPVINSATSITTNSFVINWQAATGAASYQLDVSADNFASLLTNYNNLAVIGTSQSVTGLNFASTYSYRVRSVNTSGASANSVAATILTLPRAPAANAASVITTSSFTANWQTTASAVSYRLDVSNDNFTTLLTGFNNLTVNGTSQSVTGLAAGTNYSYRVRAVNASGASVNSNPISLITLPVAPVANTATVIGETSLTANWESVTGAAIYQLDVSIDNFSTFITNYNSALVNGTSQTVIGLSPGIIYYYRVRAVNANGGASSNSSTISQITIPSTPQNFTTSDNHALSIKLNWASVVGAAEYQLQVSTSDQFSTLLVGYDPKIISASFTSFVVSNLTPATLYYFKLVAKNSAGISGFATQTSSTLNSDGSTTAISISTPQYSQTSAAEQPQDISLAVGGGIGTITVDFYHKKNTEVNFVKEPTVVSGGTYKVTTVDSWLDAFGMQFYFEARDLTNQVQQKKDGDGRPFKILKSLSNVSISLASFGKEVKNYQIISIPYQLPGRPQVHDAFEQIKGLGEYNKKKWRLFHYQDGSNVEYSDGVKASNLEQGKSYWFISKEPVALSFGQGNSFGNSVETPFLINLKKGWNQIGNPFPFDLSWADVQSVNPTIGKLNVFDNAKVAFAESNDLKAFGGGFVFADSDMSLTFPVTLPSKGGRKGSISTGENLEGNEWILPIQLSQGEVTNSLGGIGMLIDARDSKDKFDKLTPPRFLRYLEFNSKKDVYGFNFSTDVVGIAENYKWDFQIEGNSNEPVELKWSKQLVANLSKELILYDHSKHIVLDMAKTNSYSTSPNASISIYFKQAPPIEFGQIELGIPYPNPFKSSITIPYDFLINENSKVDFTVYDLTGRILVHKIFDNNSSSGLQTIKWDGITRDGSEVESGIYLYKVIVHKETELVSFNGKISKQ